MIRLIIVLLLIPLCAQAQTVDPRLAAPMIQALRAEIVLRDAALKAAQEDSAKREADLKEWFENWFGTKEAGQ